MILQKLASAIQRQDWFQVVIEVMIVIVGIFLGLQVTEWNEQRKDIIAANTYMEQLKADTVFAIKNTDETIANFQVRLELIEELLKVLKGKAFTEENRPTIERALLNIDKMQPPSIEVGHLGEIMRGNVPEIIRDQEIIRKMTELQRVLNFRINTIRGPIGRMNVPSAKIKEYHAPQPFRFTDIPASYDIEVMRNSPDFILAVQNAMSWQTHGVEPTRGIKTSLEDFLIFLEGN